jgi:hypothetical protein
MGEIRRLSSLLGQALVACTIEVDNAFEARMPHRTTAGGGRTSRNGVWLVSLAMWSQVIRFIDPSGTTIREFVRQTGMSRSDARMWLTRVSKWWRYATIKPPARNDTSDPGAYVVVPTPDGARAQLIWNALALEMQQRWERRFGPAVVACVQLGAQRIVGDADRELPAYLPVVGHGLRTKVSSPEGTPQDVRGMSPLVLALARTMTSFALDFQRDVSVPIAVAANLLRVAGSEPVRVRDLPVKTGLAKEAVTASIKMLEARGLARSASDARTVTLHLTSTGIAVKRQSEKITDAIERRWRSTAGADVIDAMAAALAEMLDRRDGGKSVLGAALAEEAGWRTKSPYRAQLERFAHDPATSLPYFPMVTHRGGFPDGS